MILYLLFIVGGNLTATFFPDDFGDLLVWEDRALYYSPNKGTGSLPLSLSPTLTLILIHSLAYSQSKQLRIIHCIVTGLTVRSLSVYTTDGTSLAPFDFQTEGYIKRVLAGKMTEPTHTKNVM